MNKKFELTLALSGCEVPFVLVGERLAEETVNGMKRTLYKPNTSLDYIVYEEYEGYRWGRKTRIARMRAYPFCEFIAGGKCETLGKLAGLWRPLSLSEALSRQKETLRICPD